MKYLLTIAVSLFLVQPLWADHHTDDMDMEKDDPKMTFEQKKAKVLENIEKRRAKKDAMLDEFKTCVNGTKDKKAIRTCRKAHREKKKAMRMEHKEKRRMRGMGRKRGK